jgi:YbgC/YbaW family acyl-CoA thioester hydrolase
MRASLASGPALCYKSAMPFWYRLYKTLLTSRWKKPLHPLEMLTNRFRVAPSETLLGVAINSRYLDYMEIARMEFLTRLGILKVAKREKWMPLVTSQGIVYKRPLRRLDVVFLTTRITSWDARFLHLEHIFTKDGKEMASAVSKACVASKGGMVSPSQVLSRIGHTSPSPLPPEVLTKWLDTEALLLRKPKLNT